MPNSLKAAAGSRTSLYTAFSSLSLELLANFFALLLTIADLLVRGVYFLITTSLRIIFRLCGVLLLMSVFLVVYLIGMGIYLAFGPGFNTHIS